MLDRIHMIDRISLVTLNSVNPVNYVSKHFSLFPHMLSNAAFTWGGSLQTVTLQSSRGKYSLLMTLPPFSGRTGKNY